MSSEEEKVALVVQRDDLSSAELGQRGEEGPEKPANRVTEEGGKVVKDELG